MLENSRYLRVTVNERDIADGERQNGDKCPIRNALHRVGLNAPKVPWDGKNGYIRVTDPETGIRYEWDIPPVAFKWLVGFDRGDDVQTLDFRLDLDKAVKRVPSKRPTSEPKPKSDESNPRTKRIPANRVRPIESL